MNTLRSFLLVLAGAVAGAALVLAHEHPTDALEQTGVLSQSLGSVSGLAYDGSALWVTLDGRPSILRVDPQSGRITRSIRFATGDTGGNAWDGRVLWQIAYRERAIYRVDVASGRYERAFPSPGEGMCSGMTFDGRHLWVANFDAGKVFQIDPRAQGRVVRTIAGHLESTGLAWDGRYLWSGLLLGVSTHDAPTPSTGFVQQQDVDTEEVLTAVAVAGVGPGTSDWVPGSLGATRFWWYDGFHDRVVVLSRRPSWSLRALWRHGASL